MPWATNVAVTLQAGDTIINPNGLFVYSAAPAAGDLIASIAPGAGTDQFGNPYEQGVIGYAVIAGNTYAIRLGLSTVNGSPSPSLFLDHVSGPLTAPNQSPAYSFGQADSTGTGSVMYSGKALAGSTSCFIECADSTLSGIAGGAVVISGGNFTLDSAGNVVITGTLTVNGSTNTGSAGLTDGTINGSSSTAGLTNGTIAGTSGGASAGTAHTHGPGSYAVNNGQHSHGSGSYAVANGSHAHAL